MILYITNERGEIIVAYYLMVEKRKGQYEPVDITKDKAGCFSRVANNFKNTGCSLEEIDLFTMHFNDIRELKEHLLRRGILEPADANKALSIRLLRNNYYHKVMYDMLYQKDLEYMMDPSRLIERIRDKLREGDYRFVESFARDFSEFHDCRTTAPEVRAYATDSIRDNLCCRHLYDLDENGDDPLTRMTKLLIYDYYQNQKGKIIYKQGIKYRNLHSVLAYVNNYDKKHMLDDEIDKEVGIVSKPKTRKRVRKPLPGQTSLF